MKLNKAVFGCLSNLKTRNKSARRRDSQDEDGLWIPDDFFRLDADLKIPPSKSFRKLAFKTQVITCPWNGLIRNRNSHTMEVVSIATTIASILGLNVDLIRAIALGHDIGHAPLGHIGEKFLTEKIGKEFRHEVFGVVVAQKIERKGRGLNLTHQTLSGILQHSRGIGPMETSDEMSSEAKVVMFSDKIAYLLADFNDALRLNLLESWIRPVKKVMEKLGHNQRSRTENIINGLCLESKEKGNVDFKDCREAKFFGKAKDMMYELYPKINLHQSEDALEKVYNFIRDIIGLGGMAVIVLALMTDNDVLSLAERNTFDITNLQLTSVWEQLQYLENIKVDITDPDLNW